MRIELNNYAKIKILHDVFSGIGIVFCITSLGVLNNIQIFFKLFLGVILGIIIAVKYYRDEDFKEAYLKMSLKREVKEELLKERNEEIKFLVQGTQDMKNFIINTVSLGVSMAKINADIKYKEKIDTIKKFVKDIEHVYEIDETVKQRIEAKFNEECNALDTIKNLKDLKLSVFVQNKITDLLWKIALADDYLSTEEEKLINSWNQFM